MPTNNASNREKEIFEQALEIPSAEERAGFIKGACGNDAQLRSRVEALLRAHEEAEGFLPEKPAGNVTTLNDPAIEKPGDRIGRYKLREKIGEGGCGIVYVAEQEDRSAAASRSR